MKVGENGFLVLIIWYKKTDILIRITELTTRQAGTKWTIVIYRRNPLSIITAYCGVFIINLLCSTRTGRCFSFCWHGISFNGIHGRLHLRGSPSLYCIWRLLISPFVRWTANPRRVGDGRLNCPGSGIALTATFRWRSCWRCTCGSYSLPWSSSDACFPGYH